MKINTVQICFTLFFGLMLSVIGTPIYTPLVEFPLELFYGADVSHISYNNSINHGTTYDFYKQTIYGGYEVMHPLKSIAIPALFFTAIISLSFFLRSFIKRSKNETTDFNKKPHPILDPILKKIKKPTKAVKQRTRLFTIALVFLFFVVGNTNFFQNKYKSRSQKQQIVQPFIPSHAIYIPNGKGDGVIWVADINNDGRGQKFVKDGAFVEFDSTNIRVKSLTIKGRKWKDGFAYAQKGTLEGLKLIYGNNQLWLVGEPNFIRAFSISSKNVTVKDHTDFKKQHPSLSSGIHEIDIDFRGGCRISLLDGQELYYDFEIDSLNKTSYRPPSSYSKEYFTLTSDNGDREVLAYKSLAESTYTYRLVRGRKMKLKNPAEESSNFEKQYFISPTILYQDSGICILSHRQDISENSATLLSAIHATDNSNNWSINASTLSRKNPNIDLSDIEITNGFVDGPNFVFKTSVSGKTNSIIAVSIRKGTISWKYGLKKM